MADTPSQSPPPSSSVSETETVAEEAPQEYWCYHCDKRVSVETVADLPDIVCHDCKNGFVESIPRSDPTSQPSDQASDPYGSPFLQVLRLIAQAARDEDAPPPLPQNHPTSEEDFLRIELDGWDNDEDEDEDAHSVEFHNEGGVENEEAEEEEEDRSDREEDENQERDEEDLRRRHRDVLRLRIRDFATRARSGRNQILDWAEILMGLEDNSIELRFEMPESDRYVGNPEDYVDAAGYEALLQTLAESDSSGRRGAPPEMLQAHSSLKTIKKKLIRKALDMIRKLAEEDPDESNDKAKKDVEKSDDDDEKRGQYTRFWNEFGKSIKLGIIEDAANRNRLAKLLRFESTKSDGKLTSLDQYISRMKSGQKDIFYLTGTSKEQLDNSPFLERLKKKGYEVIFFTDPVDEYLMQYLMDYEDKKFQNVSKEGLKLGKDSKDKELKESYKELTKWWKGALASDNVDDVKLSNRLADTPCVVVTSKFGWSANMEKIMQSQTLSDSAKQAYMRGKRVLEINPRHPIIKELRERVVKNPEDESVKHTAQLIYQTALMESGFVLPDPKDFASRIYSSVKSSLNINPDATVEEEDDTEDPAEAEAEAETPANEATPEAEAANADSLKDEL